MDYFPLVVCLKSARIPLFIVCKIALPGTLIISKSTTNVISRSTRSGAQGHPSNNGGSALAPASSYSASGAPATKITRDSLTGTTSHQQRSSPPSQDQKMHRTTSSLKFVTIIALSHSSRYPASSKSIS